MSDLKDIENYFDRLWPICRSITGNGLRDSLKIINEIVPIELYEVPTGSKVFDWEVPNEWNISEAYIITPNGEKICDFAINNLHVVNYSVPFKGKLSYEELLPHLHFLVDLPEAIPYITSYYKENWGFCISYNQFQKLQKNGLYTVVIESSLQPGSLTYGEAVLKGSSEKEILFSTYLCHPSLANNELSGPLVQAFLYKKIAAIKDRKYTYRFLFAPETIGVICYLSKIGNHLKSKLIAGYVLTCCGDGGSFTYKKSKLGSSLADLAALHVLKHQQTAYEVIPFSVGGSDERQYCSPGFNLPVGSLTRSMYQRYKEYHTSLDNKEFISFDAMLQTVEIYLQFAQALELDGNYISKIQFCEPQLGKRGLYPTSVSPADSRELIHRRMHLLAHADGQTSLLDIAAMRNESVFKYASEIDLLSEAGLLEKTNR